MWPYEDAQITNGAVIAAAAGAHGTVHWSSMSGQDGSTEVDASVVRDDGRHPPQSLRFIWSLNNQTGHVTLIEYDEDGREQSLLVLAMESALWRLN